MGQVKSHFEDVMDMANMVGFGDSGPDPVEHEISAAYSALNNLLGSTEFLNALTMEDRVKVSNTARILAELLAGG